MKKIVLLFTILLAAITLTACDNTKEQSNNWVVLPDITGLTEQEYTTQLDHLQIQYEIQYTEEQSQQYDNQFIMYIDHDAGDIINLDDVITLLSYPVYTEVLDYQLPDLTGLRKSEIITQLDTDGVWYYFTTVTTEEDTLDGLFAGYVDDNQIGDMVSTSHAIGVALYALNSQTSSLYFHPIDMVYDGPYLDLDAYANIDYLDPRGGYFSVTLQSCTDGDTARFNYPQDVYDAILSGAKSTRFLNMDTEETYSGGEEEWGKDGSLYTCGLLQSADAIILQTDPGDSLLGTYGRLLAWVWIKLPGEDNYQLLNYMVVKQGLAQVKYEFGAGLDLSYGEHTYNEWMHIAENYAKNNELGQWGNLLDYYWNYDLDEPYYDRWNAN